MSGRERLASAYLAAHPDAAAGVLETLPPPEVGKLVEVADLESLARLFGRMLPSHAALCLDEVAPTRAAEVMQKMETQDAVAVLRQLPESARLELLNALPQQWSAACELLLRYPPTSIGAWIQTLVLTLPIESSIGEARERIEHTELTVRAHIYVLDRTRRVRGSVRGLALLRRDAQLPLASLMEPAAALWAREPLAAALESELWDHAAEAPVVTRRQEFIGTVSYAYLRRVQRRLSRPPEGADQRAGIREIAELFSTGAGGIWDGVGEWVHPDTNRRSRP
jgi:magnesium transporter